MKKSLEEILRERKWRVKKMIKLKKMMELEKMDEVGEFFLLRRNCDSWSVTLSNMKEMSRNFKEKEISLKRYFLTFW